MLYETTMSTPVGVLTLVASEVGLRAVLWQTEKPNRVRLDNRDGGEIDPNGVLDAAREQLSEYFAGTRTEFDLALDPQGTDFQQATWMVLRSIAFAETVSYGEQARRMGDSRKARAVGAANGRNPLSIVVPCHRVVGADGSLTGFAAGIDAKSWLLNHERSVAAAQRTAVRSN
ncbi:MAG: methylated-DNA--[protein]-cysteine S-methyltransferase [Actinobacteria bacterium]|uniref:methylated-DNA--[protein]-cysteine S-methyltransferase n=1 Tax=freshwater metagenome TaxID=449393 RepID=A0A6J6YP63_9ZZZZ|nr:methylated-DNA--[protein]-cysteine S-methyltransferase [Actinomycetota bacterium]